MVCNYEAKVPLSVTYMQIGVISCFIRRSGFALSTAEVTATAETAT